MPTLTPDQEEQVRDALFAIGEMETEQSLKAAGVITAKGVLNCTDEEVQEVLGNLQERGLIELSITPGGQLDARRPMPIARWRWSQP